MIKAINFTSRIDSRLSYTSYDSFTGLKDKVTLLRDLQNKMNRKEDISIGMLDMDNFKSINEFLGYKVGDEFIKAISQDVSIIAKNHKIDAYRFGGDEFVVLLFSGTSNKEKVKILEEIIERILRNPIIQSRSEEYYKNATYLLLGYEKSNNKAKEIVDVNKRHEIFSEVYANSTIARQDPYILQSMSMINQRRNEVYRRILTDSIATEPDVRTKKVLNNYSKNIEDKRNSIDEYIFGRYDKNHEIYRIKKWLKDFKQNGFNLTGGIANFSPHSYKGKQPIDLIDSVGIVLKDGKSTNKGTVYVKNF